MVRGQAIKHRKIQTAMGMSRMLIVGIKIEVGSDGKQGLGYNSKKRIVIVTIVVCYQITLGL